MNIIREAYERHKLNIWILYDNSLKNGAKVRQIFEMCKRGGEFCEFLAHLLCDKTKKKDGK